MSKVCHQWTKEQEDKLLQEVEACRPLFEHYDKQSSAYTQLNAWDAIAGRMLPDVIVTGAACKRRFEKIMKEQDSSDKWAEVEAVIDKYERDLAETTFDGVAELLGNVDALLEMVMNIKRDVDDLKKMWK
jgi:succinate dehydrogenase/fumarate reductase flavoprotein subunit